MKITLYVRVHTKTIPAGEICEKFVYKHLETIEYVKN